MRKLGDKIGAKLIAEEVGVPVAPWSRGAVATWRRRWPQPPRSATR
jgi:biotin carboxylase